LKGWHRKDLVGNWHEAITGESVEPNGMVEKNTKRVTRKKQLYEMPLRATIIHGNRTEDSCIMMPV